MKSIGATAVAVVLSSAAFAAWAAAPKSLYVIRQDGTVFDNKTGLTWQREVSQSQYDWQRAKEYCGSLKLGGFSTGWRLPERLELASLVDLRIASPGPTIDQVAFPNTPNGWFWTATPSAGDSGYAWVVYFGYGDSDYGGTANALWVRCVR
jgi:hypothetical protein